MSVTSGFFNSLNGDRRYNAEQMSAIFDGIINDGVFANIGTAFGVKADVGNAITVGIGRAWYNSTWVYNDSILPMTLDASEVLLNRIDSIVIDVDHSDSVRDGTIQIVKGVPSSSPQRPTMIHTTDHHQYPLCYINRKAGSNGIVQADITNMVGTSSCPYITGILKVMNIDNIVAQWYDQWNQWFTSETQAGNNQMAQWMGDKQLEFNTWFGNLQTILDGDAATKMAEQILELQNKFKVLAREYCIYEGVEDSDGNPIEDSYDSVVTGKIVYKIA